MQTEPISKITNEKKDKALVDARKSASVKDLPVLNSFKKTIIIRA